MMENITDKARTKQRFLVLTLLDLKNAFGEVHHNFNHNSRGSVISPYPCQNQSIDLKTLY